MSNIMSLASLANKPSREGFDLTNKNAFSAKVGELLPVLTKEVLPGDKFRVKPNWLTRTRPLNSAAYTRIREYVDFYFVPTRLLWKFSDNYFTQLPIFNSAVSPDADFDYTLKKQPYMTNVDIRNYLRELHALGDGNLNDVGFQRDVATVKLLRYLDYGNIWRFRENDNWCCFNVKNEERNLFPLAAYQKIYHDFYRFEQWEDMSPATFNFDYVNTDENAHLVYDSTLISGRKTLFDLQYCNFPKDLFMGVLPNTQYGSMASVSGIVPNSWQGASSSDYGQKDGFILGASNDGLFLGNYSQNKVTVNAGNQAAIEKIFHDSSFNFGILALRQAEYLQRYKEITQSAKVDYQDQIQKHFGVRPDNSRSNLCDFLGGVVSNIKISEEVNSNFASVESTAIIKGKGVGANDGGLINFEAKEHGYFMAIYHAVPLLDWSDSCQDPLTLKTEATDYAIPELDKIGMEAVPFSYMSNYQGTYWTSAESSLIDDDGNTDNIDIQLGNMGFAPRYIDYKTSIDKIHGDLLESEKHWTAPLADSIISRKLAHVGPYDDVVGAISPSVSYDWFKVTPKVLDNIYAVNADSYINTDQLDINMAFDFKAVRNLDKNGLPY